ncbi:MAG: hypothetical protein GY941_02445 [Planctomycetes bacterium]|nr:hypothetical protein [Planctomycetota bacterium]
MNKKDTIQRIQGQSLQKLSDKDLLFLIESYVTKRDDYENIAHLIRGDEDIIGQMIDNERIFKKVMDCTKQILGISPFFMFSLFLRRSFREKSTDTEFVDTAVASLNSTDPVIPWSEKSLINLLEDTDVSNYIANMLVKFSESSQLFKVREGEKESNQYIVDMITDSLKSDSRRRFSIYCHIGNYTLFLTGMFSEYIKHRFEYRRRLVDRQYYIDFGKTYYALASKHTSAKKGNMSDTFLQLSMGFEVVAHVLHFMNRKYFSPNP